MLLLTFFFSLISMSFSNMIVMLPEHQTSAIEQIAYDVSDPNNPLYGKFLTKLEVEQIVSNPTYRNPWLSWFNKLNISYSDIGDGFMFSSNTTIPARLTKHALHIIDTTAQRHKQKRANISKNRNHTNVNPGISPRTSINALYELPDTFITDTQVTQSVIEYQNDNSFSDDDLAVFTNSTGLPPQKYTKIGHFDGSEPDGEATLDIQTQIAVGRGAKQYYITTAGWLYEASFLLLAMPSPPLVNSMSWGWNEVDQCQISSCGNLTSIDYIKRVNIEYAKLAARGITMISSSGDSGAYGRTNENCDTSTGKPLRPVFPTSSPWVTSVGGTVVQNPILLNKSRARSELCKQTPCMIGGDQTACHFNLTGWTSGGGASNVFPTPAWQQDAKMSYLQSKARKPPAKYMNEGGRFYPDVSLVANDYLIYLDGEWNYLAGTSASSPAFSGMLSQWNAARFKRNQTQVGSVNALLYHLRRVCKDCFIDIDHGSNDATEMSSCNTGWYSASKGTYDPVYGLGLPNMTAIMMH